MVARVARAAVSRSLEIRRGEEPTATLYTLLYSPAADRLLGIQKGSVEENGALVVGIRHSSRERKFAAFL